MLYYPNASCKIQQSGNHECQVFQTTTVVITFFLIRIHSIDCNLFFLILECQKHKLFTDHASSYHSGYNVDNKPSKQESCKVIHSINNLAVALSVCDLQVNEVV